MMETRALLLDIVNHHHLWVHNVWRKVVITHLVGYYPQNLENIMLNNDLLLMYHRFMLEDPMYFCYVKQYGGVMIVVLVCHQRTYCSTYTLLVMLFQSPHDQVQMCFDDTCSQWMSALAHQVCFTCGSYLGVISIPLLESICTHFYMVQSLMMVYFTCSSLI